ncbi:MAG: diacylglycerol kinase family protein [Candidatus Gastranaerophilales bacterium]|nr:diacylglycerol kinase family protein [Candidatus Gastranaerophilales bacterium]
MGKYSTPNLFKSIRHALRGLLLSVKSQRNFRLDIGISVLTIILSILLKFSIVEMSILLLVIALVLFAELINTVFEFIIDAYFGCKFSILAKMAKDISAGAVFITAMIAVIIGILLFAPKIIAQLH